MTPKNRLIKPKFKPNDIIYFKSPSRYSRSREPGTVEVILKILSIMGKDNFKTDFITDYYYEVAIIKTISSKPIHWSEYTKPASFGVDSLEIETHSRKLTPAETVLYG